MDWRRLPRTLVLLTAGFGWQPGCNPASTTEAVNPSDAPEVREVKVLTAAEKRRQRFEEEWKKLSGQLRLASVDKPAAIARLRSFVNRSKNAANPEEIKSWACLRDAEAELKRLTEEFDLEGKEAIAELEATVEKIITQKQADHTQAENEITRFRRTQLPRYQGQGLGIEGLVDELEQKVTRYQQAEFEFLKIESQIVPLRDDYARIVAVLEGFSPEYLETSYGEKIQEMIQEYYAKYVESLAQKPDIESLPTKKWPLDAYYVWFEPQGKEAAVMKDDVLVLGPNPSDFERKDDQGSYIAFGDGSWIDVWIHLEAKVKKPSKVYFGARGHEGQTGAVEFVPVSLENFDLAEDEWYDFTLIIEGPRFNVTSSAPGRAGVGGMNYRGPGYFVLQVRGDEAEITVRKLEYKVIQRDPEQVESAEEEKGDGIEKEGGDEEGDGEEKDGEEDEDEED